MSATIEQLIEVLEESERIYQQLLPVFQKEKEAAFSSAPEKFSAIVEEKEELLAHLRQLERKRRLIVSRISSAWNIPEDALRLSALADKMEGMQSSRILRLRSSLNALIRKVKRANEENRLLIHHCLAIVQGTLGFFQYWSMPMDIYGASGQMSMHQRNGHLVSGAA